MNFAKGQNTTNDRTRWHKKRRTVLLAVLGVVLAVAGWYLYRTLPVYPDFQRRAESLEALGEEVGSSQATRDLAIPDVSALGWQAAKCSLMLDGRNRSSAVIGYLLLADGETNGIDCIQGKIREEKDAFAGTEYRGAQAMLYVTDVPAQNPTRRVVKLKLLNEAFLYTVEASCGTGGLAPEQLAREEARLTEQVYAAADLILK